jgi:hypothetical protein
MPRGVYGKQRSPADRHGPGGYGAPAVGAGGVADTGFLADVMKEIASLDAEMKAFNTLLQSQLPHPPVAGDSRSEFWGGVWRPFAEEFQDFYESRTEKSAANFARSLSIFLQREVWKDVQAYRERFIKIFDSAKEAGFRIIGPDPTPPTQTPWDKAGNVLGQFGTMVKVIVYGGLGLVGVVAVASIVHNVRTNKDPVVSYADLLRERSAAGSSMTPSAAAVPPVVALARPRRARRAKGS